MSRSKLNVFFDVLSPYTYLAFHLITHHALFSNIEVTWTPVSLAGIIRSCGNKPPMAVKNKREYLQRNLTRLARLFGVPMLPDIPEGFPVSTFEVMTHLAALSILSPNHLVPAIGALYDHFFVQGGDIVDPANFLPVLESTLDAELAASVRAAAPAQGKELLESNTEAAVEQGAFGLPYFGATNHRGDTEFVWGVDHLGIAVEHLGLLPPGTGYGGQATIWRPFAFAEPFSKPNGNGSERHPGGPPATGGSAEAERAPQQLEGLKPYRNPFTFPLAYSQVGPVFACARSEVRSLS